MHQYYLLYKPYGMLSQFTRETRQQVTLADLGHVFEKDVYPVGRLDSDSEGLLLLTNDKKLNTRLLDPKNKHPRTYWVQVEGIPDANALQQLQRGVTIRIDGKEHRCLPAKARPIDPPALPERVPPIRYRAAVPDSWLEITLTEGKNRQVRRMCAAVGFPVLRLVRARIGALDLEALGAITPGQVTLLPAEILKRIWQG